MLKVALICGGTGSIAIQKGFAQMYGYKNYRLDAIINAYDNGKSTGICRKVFDGKILGPSDLRKNQLTQYELLYERQLESPDSYESKMLALFELRFSAGNCKEYYEKAYTLLKESEFLEETARDCFVAWLNYFFFQDQSVTKYRTTVVDVDFIDFSLSNIFYASCAAMNGYSLERAGIIMSDILKIENRVHLISNVDLYLSARTASGAVIADEGDIVTWENPRDRIVEAFLTKRDGQVYLPKVDENNEFSVANILRQADIVIFSSGTQWSSLIPTYMHRGFRDLVRGLSAKKYLIMNNEEDADMAGVSADGLMDTVGRYIDLDDVTAVLNDNAEDSMRSLYGSYHTIHGEVSEPCSKKHIPAALVAEVMKDYFGIREKKLFLVSDLDGTLWDSNSVTGSREISIQNMAIFRGTILSGNNYEHVYSIARDYFVHHNGGKIYCDYGNTYFDLNSPKYSMNTLFERYSIEDELVEELERLPDFAGKVTKRGKAVLTIKPLENREEKLNEIRGILRKYGDRYKAELAGHSSIDITRTDFSKAVSLERIIKNSGLDKANILYLGNELRDGNETCILETGVQTRQVDDVFVMNLLLKTYEAQVKKQEQYYAAYISDYVRL